MNAGSEATTHTTTRPDEVDGWEWALVEIFGHRRHIGRAREEERFGAKMLRIDVPLKGDPDANGWETHWYSGGSIFSYTLTDEASAMRGNKPWEPAAYQIPDRSGEAATDVEFDEQVDGR